MCRTEVFPGIQLALLEVNQTNGSRPRRGDDMRWAIRYVALLAAVASLFPGYGFAEQPPGMVATAVGGPKTVAWTSRAPDVLRMSARPGAVVSPLEIRRERPGSSEIEKERGDDIQTVVHEGEFLLPTWDRGFWLMPPGGLTRFLIPAPGFINPEEKLAPGPEISETG